MVHLTAVAGGVATRSIVLGEHPKCNAAKAADGVGDTSCMKAPSVNHVELG